MEAYQGQPPKTRLEPHHPTVHLSQCKLVIIKGHQRGREFIIARDVIRVGKSEDNDLVLPEETISRAHFEIVRDAKGYLLRDLHSTNGTFLDGAEVREAYIRAGSVISCGTVQLKFQPFEERIEILPSEKDSFGGLLGRSLRMREIFGLLERIAPTEATVLIEGETGTGKDLVARTIHEHSRRREGPFMVVDCGSVAPSLIESELFGHEKGAFTGASALRQGAFELAHGGTIFLDELDELPLDLQPKLLRVLEQREIRRVGGNRPFKVDIRVVAATKHDLRKEVERGKFREDLFFRLSVVPVRLPPLRERKEDLPLLARSFLARMAGPESANAGAYPDAVHLNDRVLQSLVAHDWPGNIRELRNVLERGVVLGVSDAPLLDSLSGRAPAPGSAEAGGALSGPNGPGAQSTHAAPAFETALSYRENKERWENDFELRYLKWLMNQSEGNISRAAREADMDRKYLHKLLKKHNLVSS